MDIKKLLESDYLTLESVKQSKTKKGVILSSGTQEPSKDGKFLNLQVLVEIDGEKKQWKVNKTSLKLLSAKYGTESEKFVGKTILFSTLFAQGGREIILGQPQ